MSTIIQQGRFTSDGTKKSLEIRSNVDWIEVINETQFATTQTPGRGVKFEWQRGMSAGHGFEYTKADGANTLQAEKITSGGFTTSDQIPVIGAAVTGTTITKASPPVCTANGHGYSNGDNVILSNLTNMPQIGGVLFTIGNVATNTFELTYMDTNTANFTSETAFEVRLLSEFTWRNSWNPITSITKGSTTQVILGSIEPELSYIVGDVVRFEMPSSFGMTEIDNITGEITAYNSTTNAYTIDIDSSSFTNFAWPASTAVPTNFPHLTLVGTTSTGVTNSTKNTASLIIDLGAGIDGPAGSSGDVIYWKAGKSTLVNNE
jgi:hypothetical protein